MIDFHDTLVDVGAKLESGQYSWVLEFQCQNLLGKEVFVGVNFYSSAKDHRYLEEMKTAVEKYGLHDFVYSDWDKT